MDKFLKTLFIILTSIACVSCDPDDEPKSSSSSSSSQQTVTRPSYASDLSTSDKTSFSIRVRFKTGGDKEQYLRATVHWKSYSTKPSKTPSKSELTKVESMRQYGYATYHNTGSKKGMTESIVFDKSHAGYSKSYIYYYVECYNSKGSASSSVTYMLTK